MNRQDRHDRSGETTHFGFQTVDEKEKAGLVHGVFTTRGQPLRGHHE